MDMGVAIRTAGDGDRELVVRLLDEAFQDDPVSGWVFPGEEYRRTTHHRLMAAFTDVVLAEGRVDLTEDGSACALWMSVPAGEPEHGEEQPDDDGFARMRRAVDPDNERVELIGRLTADIHPSGRAHEYLWMIGVAPGPSGRRARYRADRLRPRPLRPGGAGGVPGGEQRAQRPAVPAPRLRGVR
ncbi:hypothetical protein GCM10023238_20550 [Streptomyces heliomycini]